MPSLLPADIQQRIQAQLESGMFASESDVLRQAMNTLEKQQSGLAKLRELVRKADDEINAGGVAVFDA